MRERLLELGLVYDAALASLEMAEWYAEQIRGNEADPEHLAAIRKLATESAAFFAGQDVGSKAIAAIALLAAAIYIARYPPRLAAEKEEAF